MDPVNNDVKEAVLGKLFVYFLGVLMPDIYAELFRKCRELFLVKSALITGYDCNFAGYKACVCDLNAIVTSIFKVIYSGSKKHLKGSTSLNLT